MSDEAPTGEVLVRRVSFTVTGYLRHGHPVGGWYDMQSSADGGEQYSIPQSDVDEASVRDAPPERLSAEDWSEISGYVTARYGKQAGGLLVAEWARIAASYDAEEGASGER